MNLNDRQTTHQTTLKTVFLIVQSILNIVDNQELKTTNFSSLIFFGMV